MKLKSGFSAELLNYKKEEFKIDTLPQWMSVLIKYYKVFDLRVR